MYTTLLLISTDYFKNIEALLFHHAKHTAAWIVFMVSLVVEMKKSN